MIRIHFRWIMELGSVMWVSFLEINQTRSRRRSCSNGALTLSNGFAIISSVYVVKSTTTQRYTAIRL